MQCLCLLKEILSKNYLGFFKDIYVIYWMAFLYIYINYIYIYNFYDNSGEEKPRSYNLQIKNITQTDIQGKNLQ